MKSKPPSSLYQKIYCLVRQIPPGQVASYGQVAHQAGCTARTVGFAMAALPTDNNVPWQRVINGQGNVSPRRDGEGNLVQQELLKAEGISFDAAGRVDLERYGYSFPWPPAEL